MRENFDQCLAFTLSQEGGFSDNASDPGGATMCGVTLATFRTFMREPTLTIADLQAISQNELAAIYRAMYWNVNQCDSLQTGLDLMTFDMGVNAGPGRSAKLLQSCIGVDVDGIIGQKTIAAANAISAEIIINALSACQAAYYKQLPTFPTFGKGWINRVIARTQAAMDLV